MKDRCEQFELDVMKSIIAEDKILSDTLEKQYKFAKVISREFTGYGFYTIFEISDTSLRLKDHSNIELGNTQASIEGLKLGAGFVLFIRDGLIKSLECYTYEEAWPEKITMYTITNSNNN